MNAFQPLEQAIDLDAYEYLSQHAPGYLTAIGDAVRKGATPEAIRWFVQARVGPDRQPFALRCEQAARYIKEQAK